MCGLWAYCVHDTFEPREYDKHVASYKSSAPRGPDRTTDVRALKYHYCFHRLAIHDLSVQGDQPFVFVDENGTHMTYMCNGEIYNYKEILNEYRFAVTSTSDCEVIGHLMQYYNYNIHKVLQKLEGEFAFVIRIETKGGNVRLIAARDPFGVRPLYWGSHEKGHVFSSTLAGVSMMGLKGDHVTPGTYVDIQGKKDPIVSCYYNVRQNLGTPQTPEMVVKCLEDAIVTRLDSERPLGFLLSGGLDSSLVVALAARHVENPKMIRTFSIGMQGSVDLKYAKQVADHIGTTHTEVVFTKEEGLQAIPSVIQALETYDITTIRASVGQYLLAKYIRENTNIRVILNGDGADETECGYLYFYYAPSSEEAHAECIRLLENIHKYDGLRVDRTLAGNGLEARVPFLDPKFVEAYLSVPSVHRIPTKERMEKQYLRDAICEMYPDLLPRSVLYRVKNAFSDAISTKEMSWFEMIQEWVRTTHDTTESEYYKSVFDDLFPNHRHVIKEYWMPKWTDAKDPSARVLSVFTETE